jgi:hypothetical protein
MASKNLFLNFNWRGEGGAATQQPLGAPLARCQIYQNKTSPTHLKPVSLGTQG